MKKIFTLIFAWFLVNQLLAQTPQELLNKIKAKLEKVNDYTAKGKLKTNVVFIKAPIASVKVYYKKPDKMKIVNEKGISFIPKGSVNINLAKFLSATGNYEIVDAGKEQATGLRILKLLPTDENSDIVLSTLYIDEKAELIKKAKNTTRDNGTYELEMNYGKYAAYGLPDKVVFSFNTKDYKLPKGVTFDYDDGAEKKPDDSLKNKKGKVEITYSEYLINKGVDDAIFR
jgi:outer membrane lipoprotein-sorting protein